MFTGIIKDLGEITHIEVDGSNVTYTIKSKMAHELAVDQSVAHNGVCLTVIQTEDELHRVTAIKETLDLSAAKHWKVGDYVNLELAAELNARLDGHIVQGHVDGTGKVIDIRDKDGSIEFYFEFDPKHAGLVISKGSITIDGVSLTVIEPTQNTFHVAIIPYTLEHTVFKQYKVGSTVNLEFDLIGKYILRKLELMDR